jgi:nonsense-mediated mRNA decay protein 3
MTISVDIAPICKDDLILLDKRLMKECGMQHPLALVSQVTTQIHLVDPLTLRRAEITNEKYWKSPFHALDSISSTIEFIVLNVEPVSHAAIRSRRRETRQNGAKKEHCMRHNMAHDGQSDPHHHPHHPPPHQEDTRMDLAIVEVARGSDFGVNDLTFFVTSHLGRFLSVMQKYRNQCVQVAIECDAGKDPTSNVCVDLRRRGLKNPLYGNVWFF